MCGLGGVAVVESAFSDAALAVQGGNSTQSMLSEIWPFDGDFNIEKVALSCRLHVRQGPHQGNNCCPCRPHSEATQLRLSPYISGASQVSTLSPETK